MKLYTITDNATDRIIAISESKKDCKRFFRQNEYNINDYTINMITKKNKINNILTLYSERYILNYGEFLCLDKDSDNIEKIIKNEFNILDTTIETLMNIGSNSTISEKELKTIKKTIAIILDKKENHSEEFLNISGLVSYYYKNSILDRMNEIRNYYGKY